MWQKLARIVIRNRFIFLLALLVTTAIMGYFASKVQLSYEFSRAIPTDNQKYIDYQSFRQKFGDDGNMLVVGIQTPRLFDKNIFTKYRQLEDSLRSIRGIVDILSVPGAINLVKDSISEKLNTGKIFPNTITSQEELDSVSTVFFSLPFYRSVLYNKEENAYLMGLRVDKSILASKARTQVIEKISEHVDRFREETGIQTYLSGLPLIRTKVADRVQKEMRLFLIGSLLFSILILLLFFRSIANTFLSISVVLIGVIWTVALIYICGYQITLLTALIPSLVVVIGIPNCIYFINKYHSSFIQSGDKEMALVDMVSKMGIVTLFCNITAAIGFAVFGFTKSAILKEFGIVAGLSIMVIFVISFILLPAALSYLKAPVPRQLKYLDSRWIIAILRKIEFIVFNRKKEVLIISAIILLISTIGIWKLQTVARIVDDLPKTDIIYTDLKFFEKNFEGVMPLEILIDTKKQKGILRQGIDIRQIALFQDSVLGNLSNVGKPISVVDGIKFSYQAISGGSGDSTYTLPAFGNPLADLHKSLREIQIKRENGLMTARDTSLLKLVGAFVDSSEQYLRITMSMADIGTQELPAVLDTIQNRSAEILDSNYRVTLTGTTISFLEGSKFIINGLKESIFWAFLLIAACMLYLFKSIRILLCSLIPNVIPLVVTAGIMGWTGVPLKPSTVLVFSVALGIAVDITIRFLVNYKQVLPSAMGSKNEAVALTIRQTGLSIIYTSLVLIAGFIIFCASGFGGTFALGWLTSVTLLVATITNLVLLPVLLLITNKSNK